MALAVYVADVQCHFWFFSYWRSVNDIPSFIQKHRFLLHWKCRILCKNLIICAVLPDYYIFKKTAVESHRSLEKIYGQHALSETTCSDWFRRLKNGDSDLSNKDRRKPPKKFEDADLHALLDEDSTQTLKQLAEALEVDQGTISKRLYTIGKIHKEGK